MILRIIKVMLAYINYGCVESYGMKDNEVKQINSHVCLPKTILRGFEAYNERLKRNRLYYLDFDTLVIKNSSAKFFNTEVGYYSKETEDSLSKEEEAGIGIAIAEIKAKLCDGLDCFALRPSSRRSVIRYFVYQLLRDDSMAERFVKEAPGMSDKTERQVKELLIKLETNTGFLDELFDDIGMQFVLNKTPIPFLATASTSTYMADSEKYYIVELTLTPSIAVLLTNIESFKKILNTDEDYGYIVVEDEKWVREYNLSMLLEARNNKPHILVSSSNKTIEQALLDEQQRAMTGKLPFSR